jgi:hypothetical protein
MVIQIINVNSITVHKPKDNSVVSGDGHRIETSIFTPSIDGTDTPASVMPVAFQLPPGKKGYA